MSRSNPTEGGSHPCTRWHEWDGSNGNIRYYNKATKEQILIPVGLDASNKQHDFTFILLDQLGVIKGWHDASDSGITSNEVRDTTMEPFVVKAFTGGVLVSGIYQSIRDRVNALGGHFTANCYIAFRDGDALSIGSLQLKGAALKAWMDFAKKNRSALYSKAIKISGYDEGKKGKIVFRTPKFSIVELSEASNQAATELDKELQKYLAKYLSRPKLEQADSRAPVDSEPQPEAPPEDWQPSEPAPETPEDVPF